MSEVFEFKPAKRLFVGIAGGIGSEGYCSLKAKRRFIGVELKAEYFNQACRTLHDVEASAATLFDDVAA